MSTWTIVVIVAAVLIAVWIGNTVRWTERNHTLGRRDSEMCGRRDGMRGDRRHDGPGQAA